jgi:hypothetical protein
VSRQRGPRRAPRPVARITPVPMRAVRRSSPGVRPTAGDTRRSGAGRPSERFSGLLRPRTGTSQSGPAGLEEHRYRLVAFDYRGLVTRETGIESRPWFQRVTLGIAAIGAITGIAALVLNLVDRAEERRVDVELRAQANTPGLHERRLRSPRVTRQSQPSPSHSDPRGDRSGRASAGYGRRAISPRCDS